MAFQELPILGQVLAYWTGFVLYAICGAVVYRLNRDPQRQCKSDKCSGELWFSGEYSTSCEACSEERDARWMGVWWPFVLLAVSVYCAFRALIYLPAKAVVVAIGKPASPQPPETP